MTTRAPQCRRLRIGEMLEFGLSALVSGMPTTELWRELCRRLGSDPDHKPRDSGP